MEVQFDAEFDDPSLRIGTKQWWRLIKKALGKESSQYKEAESYVYDHTRVSVAKRDDLSKDHPGFAVIFDHSDFWALYFKNESDAILAARAWNETVPKKTWREMVFA